MLIKKEQVYFRLPKMEKFDAIRLAGEKLMEHGYVEAEYIKSMIEKEETDITYIGNGIAIPHGKFEAKNFVNKSGIVILHFPEGIMYGLDVAYILIGIAATIDDHMGILTDIAIKLSDEETVEKLINIDSLEKFVAEFNS